MAGVRIPIGASFTRASMDARWKARQEGKEPPPLDVTITYSDQCSEAEEKAWAEWVLKYWGIEPIYKEVPWEHEELVQPRHGHGEEERLHGL